MKFIIAILLLTIGAFAQNTTYKDGTECECDSIISTYYESGSLLDETPYKNGVIHGIYYVYYSFDNNNKLRMSITYTNNKRNGMRYINFLNDGYSYTKFVNDKAYEEIWYYKSGQIREIKRYDGWVLSGITKWYFEDGKLAGTATYKNGKLVGYKKCTDGRFGNERLNCFN